MRRVAAGLAFTASLLAGCATEDTASGGARCQKVEDAADAQLAVAQAAKDRATRAKGDEQRAESANRQAEVEAIPPATPELVSAANRTSAALSAARREREVADREALRQHRVLLQIVVAAPDCFEPTMVAEAREGLESTD